MIRERSGDEVDRRCEIGFAESNREMVDEWFDGTTGKIIHQKNGLKILIHSQIRLQDTLR
jgi:peptidyl-tRNA hydrolase